MNITHISESVFQSMLTCVLSVSAQVKVFVTGLFSLNQDIPAFKEHLRDFLVQIKVSSSDCSNFDWRCIKYSFQC